MTNEIELLDWEGIIRSLHSSGYALIPRLLSDKKCTDLIHIFDQEAAFRKTVVMARHRFGLGAYKYFNYPLPADLQSIREQMYTKLAPVANSWMQVLNIDVQYPESLDDFLAWCKSNGQVKPTPLLLKYGEGGFNTLHQDVYGEVFFPIQLALFLNEPGAEYEGGEFVLTEQIPRSQSRAIVLRPGKGEGILFTTSFHPVKGTRGYYRATMRHGVSNVISGERHTAGVIFHDATS